MKHLSTLTAIALLAAAPLTAEEVLEGTISIERVYTASLVPTQVKKTPAKTNVITAKTIKKRGYRTLTEALSHEAGIAISSNGGAGQSASVFVRGMASSDVLVTLDGVPMVDYTQPSPAPFGLENIRLGDVERIEVIKGAQSGVHGANAVAGVINIITKKGIKDYARIHAGLGSHGTRDWGFVLSDKGASGSFYLSNTLYKTAGISALAPMTAEADGYDYRDTHFRATINDGEGASVGFFAHDNLSHFEYDSGFPANPDDTLGKGTTRNTLAGLTYDYDNGGAVALKARASLSTIQRDLDGAFGPFNTTGERAAFSAVGTYRFAEDHTLSAGIERSRVSGGTTFAPATSFANDAVFADYSVTADDLLGAQTTLNAAVRYDRFDRFADKATYRLGIKRNCNVLDGLHTAANLYSAYKAPSLYQLANTAVTLHPESTTGYDISAGYKSWLNITYFSNTTTDQITNTAVWPAPASYTNAPGSQKVSGLELSGRYDFDDTGLRIGFNATRLFQDHLVRRAQNSGNLFVDYAFSGATHLNLSLRYVGARDAWDATRLAAYKTLDATFTTKVNDHIDVTLGAKNILNASYQTAKGYNTEGRSIYGRVSYTF
jgi:vitamin B12 transporter